MRIVTAASPAYLAANGEPALPSSSPTTTASSTPIRAAAPSAFPSPGAAEPTVVSVTGRASFFNGEACAAAAEAGLGIVRLPSFIAGPRLAAGALKQLLGDFEYRGSGVHVCIRWTSPRPQGAGSRRFPCRTLSRRAAVGEGLVSCLCFHFGSNQYRRSRIIISNEAGTLPGDPHSLGDRHDRPARRPTPPLSCAWPWACCFLAHAGLKIFVFTPAGTVHFFSTLGLPAALAYFTIVWESLAASR